LPDKSEELNVALDYRAQLQEKSYNPMVLDDETLKGLQEHLNKVFPNPEQDDQFIIGSLREFLAGKSANYKLSTVDIKKLLQREGFTENHPILEIVTTGETSNYDDFMTALFSEKHTKTLVNACEDIGFKLRSGFSIGVIDSDGLQAEQIPIWMTEASVINITQQLLITSNRLSKLLAKSMCFRFNEDSKYQLSNDINDYKSKLLKDRILQREWSLFFADCGYNPKKPPLGERIELSNEYDQSCFIDFSDSIINFILGHECGHHLANHSLDGMASVDNVKSDDPYKEEKEADMLGCHLAMRIGHNPEEPNWFSAINLGATCILKATQLIERSHHLLKDGHEKVDLQVNASHPPFETRIEIIKWFISYYYEDSPASKVAIEMHDLILDLFDFIWLNVSAFVRDLHKEGHRPEPVNSQWLPE
jgi:hypothetical protein